MNTNSPVYKNKNELIGAAQEGYLTLRFNNAIINTNNDNLPPFGVLRVAVSQSEPTTLQLRDNTGKTRYNLHMGDETVITMNNGNLLETSHQNGTLILSWTIHPIW